MFHMHLRYGSDPSMKRQRTTAVLRQAVKSMHTLLKVCPLKGSCKELFGPSYEMSFVLINAPRDKGNVYVVSNVEIDR
jgi:hypothetical protein